MLLETDKLLTLSIKINETRTRALIYSGASYNFVSNRLLMENDELRSKVQGLSKTVRVVNGETMDITGRLKLSIRYGKYLEIEEEVSCYVVDIANYGMILGRTWLFHHNPKIDWREGIVEFMKDGQYVVLKTNLEIPSMKNAELNVIGRKQIAEEGQLFDIRMN